MLNNNLKTWLEVSPDSDFSIHNLPFGIYADAKVPHRVCSAIGDQIIDLYELSVAGLIKADPVTLNEEYLNPFYRVGKKQLLPACARMFSSYYPTRVLR